MGLGSFINKFLGAGGESAKPQTEIVEYNGYNIQPAPRKQGSQYLTVGVISKTFSDGAVKEHEFIRADTHASFDDACSYAIRKGQQIIDEQGDRLFGKG